MPAKPRSPILVGLLSAVGLAALSLLAFAVVSRSGGEPGTTTAGATSSSTTTGGNSPTTSTSAPTSTTGEDPTTTAETTTTTTTTLPFHAWVDRRTVGQPWGEAVTGILTFRGNPTHSWYGTGPVPETPRILWKYPEAPMGSVDELGDYWTGVTWTGQPLVWERPDGVTELIFGATDARVHFLDAVTGAPTRRPFFTSPGGHIKGTPTLDPDGFPLLYFGARDHKLRIVALDRDEPAALWSFDSDDEPAGRWWRDWDASPRIVNDLMFEGGENSFFYIWKLNRAYGADGQVTVDPVLLFKMPIWNDELLAALEPSRWIGPRWESTSVECSAAIFEGRVYFGNSAGRIIGLDITNVEQGEAPLVFDFWVGDDSDASMVIDGEGMLYVPVERKRFLPRGQEVGQLVKLNPYAPDDPFVWGMFSLTDPPYWGGLFASPALGDGVVYAVTNRGYLVAVDQETGEETWSVDIGAGAFTGPRHMSSPIVVGDRLVVATAGGRLQSYDVTDPRSPVLDWDLPITDGAIEATPAAWNGIIYIGSRDGFLYAVGE